MSRVEQLLQGINHTRCRLSCWDAGRGKRLNLLVQCIERGVVALCCILLTQYAHLLGHCHPLNKTLIAHR